MKEGIGILLCSSTSEAQLHVKQEGFLAIRIV